MTLRIFAWSFAIIFLAPNISSLAAYPPNPDLLAEPSFGMTGTAKLVGAFSIEDEMPCILWPNGERTCFVFQAKGTPGSDLDAPWAPDFQPQFRFTK